MYQYQRGTFLKFFLLDCPAHLSFSLFITLQKLYDPQNLFDMTDFLQTVCVNRQPIIPVNESTSQG